MNVQLLFNDEQYDHGQALAQLLPEAKQLECIVAFAKISGLKFILEELKEKLATGLTARFVIGLDFYLTEPELLKQLLGLSNRYELKLYISYSSTTFHPKIYALSYGKGCTVLIGSANLTGGGLQDNYEASAQIDDPTGKFMRSVSEHVDDLIEQNILVPATDVHIAEYERLYLINQVQQRLAKRRAEKAKTLVGINTETLRDILLEMKKDTSENGFESQKSIRSRNRKAAARKIKEIASMKKLDATTFRIHYEQLIQFFHSGGLHRGKNIIADNADKFQAALAAIVQSDERVPSEAYQLLLDHFRHIPRAGVNVLTEILLAIDCKRFAIMNQNAVSGLRLANIHDFPPKPNKTSVNAGQYELYCQQADTVRKELGLTDFAELDALFNYAYWGYETDEVEDE